MARPKVCQRHDCSRMAAVEVVYVLGKGALYRFPPAEHPGLRVVDPSGVREAGVLCRPCATACIAGDDPPFDHTWFADKPKQVRAVDATPRFFESMGVDR